MRFSYIQCTAYIRSLTSLKRSLLGTVFRIDTRALPAPDLNLACQLLLTTKNRSLHAYSIAYRPGPLPLPLPVAVGEVHELHGRAVGGRLAVGEGRGARQRARAARARRQERRLLLAVWGASGITQIL